MRRTAVLLLALALAPAGRAAAQPALAVWLDLVGRGVAVDAAPSWLDGGTGRLAFGDPAGGYHSASLGEARLGLDWRSGDRFTLHLHARARAQEGDGGRAAGLVEAWAQLQAAPRGGADRFRLRAGQLFLPTSRENVRPLWSSPYTLTLSALNSWIGEEVRPIGVLAEYDTTVDSTQGVRAGACLFGGNDSAGALLAWRGWTMGDRLTVSGETLPLPGLPSLAAGGPFAEQDRHGTTPFEGDLDGRPGWAAYLRYRRSDVGLVQLTHLDNRGDRALHDVGSGHGEYAWDTRFDLVGAELHPGVGWTLAGEHLRGETKMGLPVARAYASFHASYLLLSWQRSTLRLSGRWDGFATRDEDHLPAGERSDEDGHAWTAAVLWQPLPALELGLDFVAAHVERPALVGTGERLDGGRTVTASVRCQLGHPG